MDCKEKIDGARAFSKGTARHECPHEVGSVAFQDWTDGWAQQKASDERSAVAHEQQMRFARAG